MKPRFLTKKYFKKMVVKNGRVIEDDELEFVVKRGKNNQYKEYITGHENNKRIRLVKPANTPIFTMPMIEPMPIIHFSMLAPPLNRTNKRRNNKTKRRRRK